jgi:hypothetical protein
MQHACLHVPQSAVLYRTCQRHSCIAYFMALTCICNMTFIAVFLNLQACATHSYWTDPWADPRVQPATGASFLPPQTMPASGVTWYSVMPWYEVYVCVVG